MSKIPQGEWSAIAARHAQGESLSAIARSYGCTPPAIHYVLKRSGRQSIEKVDQPAVEKVDKPAEAVPSPSSEPVSEAQPQTLRLNGEVRLSTQPPTELTARGNLDPAVPTSGPANGEQLPPAEPQRRPSPARITGRPLAVTDGLDSEHRPSAEPHGHPSSSRTTGRPVAVTDGLDSEHRPSAEPRGHPSSSRTTGRPLAVTDGLDSELHERAEAAIEAFRSCFDAALAEGSPHERARLRQAASDLMRVAARTTIVLDRLNALSERATARVDPRSNRNWPT